MPSSVGDAVIDGYKQTASWLDNGVEWLSDVIDFYNERAAIEREAASKLASLTSKHFSKKASVSAAVSVGDNPLTTPGSLENMTMQSWMETLNQTEKLAAERKQLSEELSHNVADELSALKTRFEDIFRSFKRFNEALEERRDKTYQHVKKAKHHYDACCESMEHARAKSKKSVDSKESEMYKAKNSYLIQINIANRMKDKYYHDDLPEILDAMQRTNEARVAQTNRLVTLAGNLEKTRLEDISKCLDASIAAIGRNAPSNDSEMFVEHNANAFQWGDPADFLFEPSPIWHDDDEMYSKSEDSLRYLSARLGEANMQSASATSDSQNALQIYEQAKKGETGADFGTLSPAEAAPFIRNEVSTLQRLVEAESNRLEIEVEIEAIEAGTASVDMSHVPQTRVKTQRNLFGKKKEVVEVVQDGGGASKHSRSLGLTSLLSRAHISSRSGGDTATKASVLYDFTGGGPGELTVSAGEELELLQGDDGSGWIKLSNGLDSGLVPAAYVEILFGGKESANSSAVPPPPPPARGSKDPKVIALYNYDAGDESQLTIRPNDLITVVEGDRGGWTTGVLNGKQGIFPTAYTRPA